MKTNEFMAIRRKELGLTLEEVAQRCGVGKSTVRKWEKGLIKNMGRDKIDLLAGILQVSPVLLLKDDFTADDLQRHFKRVPMLGHYGTSYWYSTENVETVGNTPFCGFSSIENVWPVWTFYGVFAQSWPNSRKCITMYKAAGAPGGWFYFKYISIIFTFSAAVMASIFFARVSRISGVSRTLSRTSKPRE